MIAMLTTMLLPGAGIAAVKFRVDQHSEVSKTLKRATKKNTMPPTNPHPAITDGEVLNFTVGSGAAITLRVSGLSTAEKVYALETGHLFTKWNFELHKLHFAARSVGRAVPRVPRGS